MFHFTLRHKSGKTFGPDGLSRRDKYPGDPEFANSEEFEDEPNGPPEFIYAEGQQEEPLDFEEFKDIIDNRKGYMQGVAESYLDIKKECIEAETQNTIQRGKSLKEYEKHFIEKGMRPDTAAVFAQLLLPEESYLDKENMAEFEYPLHIRSEAGKRADEWLALV